MMNIQKTLVIGIAAMMLTTGCKKYEDGPAVSFRSKKARIANTWRVEKALNGSEDVTSDFDQYELQMLTNGNATLSALYHLGDLSFEFQTNGTWSLENNNEDLRLDFENDAADETYEILRLKEDELWLRTKSKDLELHLTPR